VFTMCLLDVPKTQKDFDTFTLCQVLTHSQCAKSYLIYKCDMFIVLKMERTMLQPLVMHLMHRLSERLA